MKDIWRVCPTRVSLQLWCTPLSHLTAPCEKEGAHFRWRWATMFMFRWRSFASRWNANGVWIARAWWTNPAETTEWSGTLGRVGSSSNYESGRGSLGRKYLGYQFMGFLRAIEYWKKITGWVGKRNYIFIPKLPFSGFRVVSSGKIWLSRIFKFIESLRLNNWYKNIICNLSSLTLF